MRKDKFIVTVTFSPCRVFVAKAPLNSSDLTLLMNTSTHMVSGIIRLKDSVAVNDDVK